jgi:tetratricopeptide (TPR) repeat protein
LSKYTKAIECYDKSIEFNLKVDEVWYHKGEALNALGRATEIEVAFTKAKELEYKG